jgi:hypothetical protein
MPDVNGITRTFETGVVDSTAVLTGSPRHWSYSSLKQVEECPRRYSLTRASYPELWERRGYPQAPTRAALFGDVVHGAIERILKALAAADCTSVKSAEAVSVLKALGGYTAVAEQVLAERLAQLDGNPRVRNEQRRRLDRDLGDRMPDARGEIQEYLSRLPSLPNVSRPPSSGDEEAQGAEPVARRREITNGPYPELNLAAEPLRLVGRIDLLTLDEDGVRITDFKTGAEDPSHQEQLLTYALLWAMDRVVNPHCRPCHELRAAYPQRDAVFPPPDEDALAQLAAKLGARIQAADDAVVAASPDARLSDGCRLCGVRPLCADYWADPATAAVPSADGEWFDVEGTVAGQHGAKSWFVQLDGGRGSILVRMASPSETLPLGRSVRLLGVRRVVDPDDPDALIAAMGASTETFMLAET